MTHRATKISIVVEKLIQDGVTQIIKEAGARGFTVIDGSGEGSHGVYSGERPSIVGAFAIVKIEVIVADAEAAQRIADAVTQRYFEQYAGIVYLETVQVLRPGKFSPDRG